MPYHGDQAEDRVILYYKRKVEIIDLTPEEEALNKKAGDDQFKALGRVLLSIPVIIILLKFLF